MVVIKDFEMPKNCGECPILALGYSGDYCSILEESWTSTVTPTRLRDCPLVEIEVTNENDD